MELANFIRTPVFMSEGTSLDDVLSRVKNEDHPFAFCHTNGEYYAIDSSALGRGEHPCDPPSNLNEYAPIKLLTPDQLSSHVLDVLSQPVTLLQQGGTLCYFRREDYLLSMTTTGDDADIAWLRTLFSVIPRGLIIVDLNYRAVNSNAESLRMLRMSGKDLARLHLHDVLGETRFKQVLTTHTALLNQVITVSPHKATILVDFVPLIIHQSITGFALILQDLPSVEGMALELSTIRHLNQDLETILSTIYDEIVVVDGQGRLLRASEHFIQNNWKLPPAQLIGESLFDIKAEDDVLCRIIRQVSDKKEKVSLMQNTEFPVLSVGNPILTDTGRLDRIVIASRDLTEVTRLRGELEKTKKEGESYRKQLALLKARGGIAPDIVYASPLMDEVIQEVQRVARFDTTALLVGESGVGKEVMADLIHASSHRREKPFIKINCGAIPEALLESELFGYEKGAFSGAHQQGKKGLFIKAHQGTLFLDEVSDLPLGLQVKLLRALQDREVYPVGATTPVKFDVRFIAATNRPLAQLVQEGKFREDLFYRISVYPIEIPPLRARKADIAVLANHFLFKFNQSYGRDLRFSTAASDLLEAFDFPGNVRQLQNIVQRVAIKTEGDAIDVGVVERILTSSEHRGQPSREKSQQVVPLKRAMKQLEEELIVLAMRKYRSTTQAAKALGINQSTVSRKYREIQDRNSHGSLG